MRIGIDVGGTNTDAVLMDGERVLAEIKTSTTADVTAGIVAALESLIADSGVSAGVIQAVMIGTTHFTNAVVEARHLVPTAAVRLGLPATQALPPMVDWPDRLREALGGHLYLCHGGHEFDGREISALDPDELRRVAADIGAKGVGSIAISSVFSPVNAEFELRAAEILQEELPGVAVSLSHEIGRMGLLERENATIMNACLRPLAVRIVGAFNAALDRFGIAAPVYLSQNDGTLMAVDFAERYPVATFASGPTNSMRGAAFLSGEDACAVVDIGGTTSDVGVLQGGFPREASVAVEIGGVRTNFRMPDVLPLGIGGGSLIREDHDPLVGPQSVGYELTSKALVFGGDTLTASDLAVADGRAAFGDPARVADLDGGLVTRALRSIEERIAEAIDRMKTSAQPIPVVLVGGGSVLLRDTLAGASRVIRPDHFGAANAIGAAIAQIGGEVERVFSLGELTRDEALRQAKDEACQKAVDAGASTDSVRIVDVEEVGLAYLPGNATRIKVKAVGDLELPLLMRLVGEDDLDDLALGAAILGTGGGGDPYVGKLMAKQAIREHGPVTVVDASEVPDEALVVPAAMMGAPTIMVEKIPRGDEIVSAFRALGEYLGRPVSHTVSAEAGGLNSTTPFVVAAAMGIPLVDADMMGRAYPELQMCIPGLYGVSASPMAIADEKGNASIIETVDNRWTERLARAITIEMGCSAMIALYALTGAQVKESMIHGTLGLCQELGRLVRGARAAHGDPVAAVTERLGGVRLFTGKVSDVSRRTEGGFARAETTIDGLGAYAGRSLVLSSQNEYLMARSEGEVVASTPDLIMALDTETGDAITTEGVRYGYRVTVIAAPCDPRWRSPGGLELVGPRYFGYDVDYVPVEELSR